MTADELRLEALKLAVDRSGDATQLAAVYYDFLRGASVLEKADVAPPAAEDAPHPVDEIVSDIIDRTFTRMDRAEKPDPTKWFDLEDAPKDGRLVVLAPRAASSMPNIVQWIGSTGVVARWSRDLAVWIVSLVDATDGGYFEDDYFFAYRPLRPAEFTRIENVAASHPPSDPIETIGAELSLKLPEYVTIRARKLTQADQAILLRMMQDADRAPLDGLPENA